MFLLQGFGRRRWQVSRQRDLDLVAGAPLKILRRFHAEDDWILDPGDMLYLPPQCAHHGVAVDECTTYSIGFRAPALRELTAGFLEDFADRLDIDGLYADPDLKPTQDAWPHRCRSRARDRGESREAAVPSADVEDFLGRHLTEPKAHVFFDPPAAPVASRAFDRALARDGITLDLKSLMLYGTGAVYLNGECIRFPRGVPEALRTLADRRHLPPSRVPPPVAGVLRDWHANGFLHLSRIDLHGDEP